MILGYDDIQEELTAGELRISPYPDDEAFQPASIDVRLGIEVTWRGEKHDIRKNGWMIAESDGLVLGSTLEELEIPRYLAIQLDGKSTLARKGLEIHRTAGWLDPGFCGEVTLEMSIKGDEVIHLWPGMYIGQLKIMPLRTPTSRWYGKPGLNSHYQGQRGPTPAAY